MITERRVGSSRSGSRGTWICVTVFAIISLITQPFFPITRPTLSLGTDTFSKPSRLLWSVVMMSALRVCTMVCTTFFTLSIISRRPRIVRSRITEPFVTSFSRCT